MKISVLAALTLMFSMTCQACDLSAKDFEALAASPSHLTPSAFSALSPERRDLVCKTRAFIKKIDAQKGVMEKIEKWSAKYLNPAENDRMVTATNEHLFRVLKLRRP